MRNGKSYLLLTAVCLPVNVRLPWRPCLPALMDPEPLVRVKTDHPLNGRREASRVHLNVLIMIAGANQLDRRVTVKKVALPFLVPNGAGWDHHGISLQGERCDARGCASQLPKEGNKNSFARLGVEIGQDTERATFA